jgi:hypothetical protein
MSTIEPQPTENEFEWGAVAIGRKINRPPRWVYHIAETRPQDVAGLKKVGNLLVLHVKTWRRSFEEGADRE